VDVLATALDDLRGVHRLRRDLRHGALPVDDIARQLGRHAPAGGSGATTWRQVQRFAGVGVVSTVVHLGLFAVLSVALGSDQLANLSALLLATLVNTGLNRRWTFGVRGASGHALQQVQALAVFGFTWLVTAGALDLLHRSAADAPTVVATAVLALATAASTVLRFVAMRSWIFRPRDREAAGPGPSAAVDPRPGPVEVPQHADAAR
jgi:putative flippase GtrA